MTDILSYIFLATIPTLLAVYFFVTEIQGRRR